MSFINYCLVLYKEKVVPMLRALKREGLTKPTKTTQSPNNKTYANTTGLKTVANAIEQRKKRQKEEKLKLNLLHEEEPQVDAN